MTNQKRPMTRPRRYVTIALLRHLNACEDQILLFEQTFGVRAQITSRNIARAVEAGLAVWWIAAHVPNLRLADRERLAAASDDPAYWRGWIGGNR